VAWDNPVSNLLYLTQRLPYPPIKGEKIRPLQILKYLARFHDVSVGCLIDDPSDEQHIATIRAMVSDIHVARLDPRVARITCLRGLFTDESLSVTFFRDAGLTRWVRDVIERVRPEVIFVNSGNMAPYVLDQPRTGRRLVDLADVDSEKWRAYAESTKGPMRFVYRREWRKVAALERRIVTECDLASFVSTAEADLFKQLHPDCAGRIRGVSSGVEHRYFDPSVGFEPVYDTSVPNYVFTGTMDYKPNVDAVSWFVHEILPLVRLHAPDAQFHIVGNGPNDEVLRLAREPGVFVTGRVPDVRPYVTHATASVAPILIARGIQNKVLEAMSLARPVVLTSGALEGIRATPGREVLLADTAASFAGACIGLARDGDRDRIGDAARSCILRHYDWDATLAGFDDMIIPQQAMTFAGAP
jgi:polysaccharide biosynthesis protein PslH